MDLGQGKLGQGIVTCNDYVYGPDGRCYKAVWASGWISKIEKDVLGQRVRGNSGFFLVAYNGEVILDADTPAIVIPGCQFIGFVGCEDPVVVDVLSIE